MLPWITDKNSYLFPHYFTNEDNFSNLLLCVDGDIILLQNYCKTFFSSLTRWPILWKCLKYNLLLAKPGPAPSKYATVVIMEIFLKRFPISHTFAFFKTPMITCFWDVINIPYLSISLIRIKWNEALLETCPKWGANMASSRLKHNNKFRMPTELEKLFIV